MANYFSALILRKYLTQVYKLALSLNVPKEWIIFSLEGCPLGSIEIYIKFETKSCLDEFREKLQEIPCILEML